MFLLTNVDSLIPQLRQLQLKQEMEKSRVLQDALHVLATEHHELEQSLSKSGHRSPHRFYDTDEDEFYDCDEEENEGMCMFYSKSCGRLIT